jgi:TIR domain
MDGHSDQSPLLFLSHSRADTDAALGLKRRIEEAPSAQERGLKVWTDKDDLLPGREWQEQLEEIIQKRATAFAVYVGSGGVINWQLMCYKVRRGPGKPHFHPCVASATVSLAFCWPHCREATRCRLH